MVTLSPFSQSTYRSPDGTIEPWAPLQTEPLLLFHLAEVPCKRWRNRKTRLVLRSPVVLKIMQQLEKNHMFHGHNQKMFRDNTVREGPTDLRGDSGMALPNQLKTMEAGDFHQAMSGCPWTPSLRVEHHESPLCKTLNCCILRNDKNHLRIAKK